MNVVELDEHGQVSIPKAVLERLGVESDQMLLVEVTEDGAIVLRPIGVHPLELYGEVRISEFLEEDAMPAALRKRVAARLADDQDA